MTLAFIFAFAVAAFVADRSGDLDWPWSVRVLVAVALFIGVFALLCFGWPRLSIFINKHV